MPNKAQALAAFFRENNRMALAFSGGVDSAYLLSAAISSGAEVRAYYVKAQFQPEFEYRDAQRLAGELGADMRVIECDILACESVRLNPPDRCYHCKREIFGRIAQAALEDGYTLIIDGTNASDDAMDRPGMRALQELSVRSPLRECGITKREVRMLSRAAELFTWDKPAYACLATRIKSGVPITAESLQNIEWAEDALFALGFSDFRVRVEGSLARLQMPKDQFPRAAEHSNELLSRLGERFDGVVLDLKPR